MKAQSISPFIETPLNKNSISKRKPIFGVGINDADYKIEIIIAGKRIHCPYYQRWTEMFRRCYSEKYHINMPTYIDCTVAKEWHTFSNFRKWMEARDWKGKELDKDILIVGNKVYSPETCIFVSSFLNSLLRQHKTENNYPKGVNFDDRKTKQFVARCNVKGKRKYLGEFETKEEAGKAYKIAKSKEVNRIALLQSDIRIKDGLIRHAEYLLNG